MSVTWWAVPVLGLLLAAEPPSDEAAKKELTRELTQLNEAFTKNDADAIKRLMTEDHVAVLASGVRLTRAEMLKTLSEFKLTSYTVDDLTITLLSKDAALAAYQ